MPFLDRYINVSATAAIMAEPSAEEVLARFEELAILESEFEDVELELSMPFFTPSRSSIAYHCAFQFANPRP
jgi:hypothetical protein